MLGQEVPHRPFGCELAQSLFTQHESGGGRTADRPGTPQHFRDCQPGGAATFIHTCPKDRDGARPKKGKDTMRRILFALLAITSLIVTAGCRMVAGQCDCYDPGATCLCGSCGYEQVLKTPGHDPILPHGHPQGPVHVEGPIHTTPMYNGTANQLPPHQPVPAQQMPKGQTEPPKF